MKEMQTEGVAEGTLIGGYARNFALILGNKYFPLNMGEKYVLFIEDHESFGGVDYISAMLTAVEQDKFMENVTGVVFGNYSGNEYPELWWRLRRMGRGIRSQWYIAMISDTGGIMRFCQLGEKYSLIPIRRS